MPQPKIKTVADAATRFARVVELWVDVRVEEAAIAAASLERKAHVEAREELLAKIGTIIEDAQMSLPFEDEKDPGS